MPVYAAIFMIMTMSSIGLPTLNGFIGEFLILQGAFIANIWWAVVAASGLVLGAAYMLWLYQRTMFGKIENPKNEKLPDLNLREIATFVPLIILAVWIGIYPTPFLDAARADGATRVVRTRVQPGVRAGRWRPKRRGADCGDEREPAKPRRDGAAVATPAAPCRRRRRAARPAASRRAGRGEPRAPSRSPRRRAPRRRAALMPAWFSLNDLYYLLPELVLAGGGRSLLLVATALTPRTRQAWLSWLGLGVLGGLGARDGGRHAGRAGQRRRAACCRSTRSAPSSRPSSCWRRR